MTGEPTRGPAWTQPEIAWFLAVAVGFSAAWVGAIASIPGAGGIIAAICAVVFQFVLLRRGLYGTAGMAAVAVALGVALAAVGLVGEGGLSKGGSPFPLAAYYVTQVIRPLLDGDSGGVWLATALSAVAATVLLLLARPTQGLVPLVAGTLAAGALGAAGAEAGRPGEGIPAVLDGLQSIPPWGLLQLAGVLLLQVVLAGPEPVFPLEELRQPRRRVLATGLALLGIGLFMQPLAAEAWAAWVPAG